MKVIMTYLQTKKDSIYPGYRKVFSGVNSMYYFLFLLVAVLLFSGCAQRYVTQYPNPEKPLVFPRDHSAHDNDAHWEWWYFNGTVESESGNTYDYFWSFFKVFNENDVVLGVPFHWVTAPFPMYMPFRFGGFSVFDRKEDKYVRKYKCNIPFWWNSGYQKSDLNLWIGKNKAWRNLDNTFRVQSTVDDYELDLTLTPERPPFQHGVEQNGTLLHPDTIQKYYNITRIKTEGTVKKKGVVEKVSGTSWFDHQYGFIYNDDLLGYDWLCINLDNGVDLLFTTVRYISRGVIPQSFCGIMYPDGRSEYMEISESEFKMRPLRQWKSDLTGTRYGVDWEVEIPSHDIKLTVKAISNKQEMITVFPPIAFWEGAGEAHGTYKGETVQGRSFLETWGDYKVPLIRSFYSSKMRPYRSANFHKKSTANNQENQYSAKKEP